MTSPQKKQFFVILTHVWQIYFQLQNHFVDKTNAFLSGFVDLILFCQMQASSTDVCLLLLISWNCYWVKSHGAKSDIGLLCRLLVTQIFALLFSEKENDFLRRCRYWIEWDLKISNNGTKSDRYLKVSCSSLGICRTSLWDGVSSCSNGSKQDVFIPSWEWAELSEPMDMDSFHFEQRSEKSGLFLLLQGLWQEVWPRVWLLTPCLA